MDALTVAGVKHAFQYLKDRGFIVLPPERRVIVQAREAIPLGEMERSRMSAERVADMAQETCVRRIVRELFNKGLCVHSRQDIDDAITGREVVFTSAIGVIKPSEVSAK